MLDFEAQRNVERFLFREARLLDAGQFEAWLALYEPDGIYWIPSKPGQTDPINVASIAYEDHPILSIRVQRLIEARALVLTPMPRTTHVLGNVEVESLDESALEATAAFICVQYQANMQRIFSGQQMFRLRSVGDDFRILLKRTDLLNSDGTLPLITIPL
jgi:benzoate/toluate 1,2-dioxygenase beta subunit